MVLGIDRSGVPRVGTGPGCPSERLMASRVAVRSAGRGEVRRPKTSDLWSAPKRTPSGGWGVVRSPARASYGDLGAAIEASGAARARTRWSNDGQEA